MKKNEDFESLRSKRYKLLGVASSVLLKFYGSTPPTKINGLRDVIELVIVIVLL